MDFATCSMVKMWLVDTGCGYDLVSKREVALMKRFAIKAKHTITFHTANGPTVTENVANVYVKELSENIAPYILYNTHPVGYRCMELGYALPRDRSSFVLPPINGRFTLMVEKSTFHT